jgi:dienelactone hydrolase
LRSLALALLALAFLPAAASAALPDPLARGPYAVTTVDPVHLGLLDLQEPNAGGGATTGASAAATVQLRGSLYYPADRAKDSPVIVLVHGNHGSCDSGSAPNCTAFKRNDRGYAYLGNNLATWGYTVLSLDQDQLIFYQDSQMGKGMHQRRRMIAAALDALYAANQAPLADDANTDLGGRLVGKLDFSRIGLMGHSRGGDAVTSFIDYNRTRPAPGRRYDLRGVISLAPVDYERRAPYGVPYMTYVGYCDGDVSNLQGARFFERSQYIQPGDPYPRIQAMLLGANHNWFNTVWFADGDDATGSDAACATSQPNNIRLSGGGYDLTTRGSGDPALMGDQEKAGLAVMSAFFRRYVGGDVAFDPYMTGEVSADGVTPQLPASACPSSAAGTRIPCFDRLMTSYFAPPAERRDVIRPETDNPLTVTALGTALTGSGFSNPYLAGGGVAPLPPTTDGGFDWCNPEPLDFTPSLLGTSGLPTAAKPCPLPAAGALGGQSGTRENAPVNHSYGLQLALAWDQAATLGTRIPAASGNVAGFKALALGAAVNFFDPRNPARTGDAVWNPGLTTQDFTISLTDAAGHVGTVAAASPRYGTALHQTTGTTTARTHIVLNQIRVPLGDFAAQGVDLTSVRRLDLGFGAPGKPASGSIELADVRFQEAVAGPTVYTDKLRDVPVTPPSLEAPVSAPAPETFAAPAGTTSPATARSCAAPALASVRVMARRVTVTGTAARCASGVVVTITRTGSARSTVALRVAAAAKWTVRSRPLAPGRYRVALTRGATRTVAVH